MVKVRTLFPDYLRPLITSIFIIMMTGSVYAQDRTQPTTRRVIFSVVEEPPVFPGGVSALQKYLEDNLQFPDGVNEKFRNKPIFTNFIINETGTIDSARVVKHGNKLVDAEVIRVIEGMPAWAPGKQSGYTVAVRYNVSVRFPKK